MQDATESGFSRDRSEAVLGLEISLLMITSQGQGKSHSAGQPSIQSSCNQQIAASAQLGVSALKAAGKAGSPQSKKACSGSFFLTVFHAPLLAVLQVLMPVIDSWHVHDCNQLATLKTEQYQSESHSRQMQLHPQSAESSSMP